MAAVLALGPPLRTTVLRSATVKRYESDQLTHFVGRGKSSDKERFDLLVKILSEGELRGSGKNVVSPNAKISKREMFDPNIVCFCDIPLSGLTIHTEKYGSFGLAFQKAHLVNKGATPVFYVALGSRVRDVETGTWITRGDYLDKMAVRALDLLDSDTRKEKQEIHPLNAAINGERIEGPILTARQDAPHVSVHHFMVAEILPFIVPFDERLPIHHKDNYYMEREWRIGGPLRFVASDLAQILLPKRFHPELEKRLPNYGVPLASV